MTEQEYIASGDYSWKLQDWEQCLNFYSEAIRINPLSIASENEVQELKTWLDKRFEWLNQDL